MDYATVYVICPDFAPPSGGVKQLYRHVDILNRHGIRAFIVHQRRGFRVRYFHHSTPIVYNRKIFTELNPPRQLAWKRRMIGAVRRTLAVAFRSADRRAFLAVAWHRWRLHEVTFGPRDILVMPEIYGPNLARAAPGLRKIVFNQNAHYTFWGYSWMRAEVPTPYEAGDFMATIVISDQNLAYLQYAFPDHPFRRVHYGFDPAVFAFSACKQRQVAFMTRKLPDDVEQVINLIRVRRALPGFQLVAIENLNEQGVARILRDAMIFLSFSHREGCPMPPTEAMACGCVVIGYDGFGGREYFKPEFSYPVPEGDVVAFVQTIERAMEDYRRDPDGFLTKGRLASEFVARNYSLRREEEDVIAFWTGLSKEPARRLAVATAPR